MAQRVAIGIEYDGRAFCGWQTQPGGCAIQDRVQAALAQIHGAPVATIAAGRTDAGVHALAQVVHFDAEHVRPASAWVRGVNAFLPAGISVLWARAIGDGFDARRSAIERCYRYFLINRSVRPALLAGRVGWLHGEIDDAAMQAAATHLVGTHDFSAFRAADCQARTPIRDMRAVTVERRGEMIQFEFRANAFLHHQVRNMVGALAWVGLRRRPPEWVADVLASRDRRLGAATFAPDGLYLVEVKYDQHWGLPASGGIIPFLIPAA